MTEENDIFSELYGIIIKRKYLVLKGNSNALANVTRRLIG